MTTILKQLTHIFEVAFEQAGYDRQYGRVSLSNRPDLCEYQCNGAMAAAKVYKKAPFMIANEVKVQLQDNPVFGFIDVVNPGFINIILSPEFLSNYVADMTETNFMGVQMEEHPKTIIVDYGGPNVAKPLHIGHLRSAIIGESVKRILRFMGNTVYGDIHLGDWGYQMGLIITELKVRKPELPYFLESYDDTMKLNEAPFTITELEEIYPCASAKAKEDEDYRKNALHATYLLQHGHKGFQAIWKHIIQVSVEDLKKVYDSLDVEFDIWKGEADAQPYIPAMVEMLKEKQLAKLDEGALVVDVSMEDDKKDIPPCIILKSDGAALYGTTDLATLVEREQLYHPSEVIYFTDKRQELHFTQVFRVAKLAGIVDKKANLQFIGFGTMNGKDGKPFKTRDGGVMRLENLISMMNEETLRKIQENRTMSEQEAQEISKIVGLAALKYGDLSNQAAKDYIFDIDRFTSFEGNTGPYILYTIVRIKSILSRYEAEGGCIIDAVLHPAIGDGEKALMLEVAKFADTMDMVYAEKAPHRICAYIFDLANVFNRFYHETKILSETNVTRRASYIALLKKTQTVLEICIELLGFQAPDKM